MKVNRSDSSGAAVELTRDELLTVNNALNEVCHGPGAIDDEEFFARMGVELHEAMALLDEVNQLLPDPPPLTEDEVNQLRAELLPPNENDE